MNYLDFYHFDNQPFVINETQNYFFKRKSFVKIMEQMLKFCRIYSGIYIIEGSEGVGKSLLVQKLYNSCINNDISLVINMTEKTDILQIIANKLKLPSKNIDNIVDNLTNFYEEGQNIILFFDDVHNCNLAQFNIIGNLIEKMPFLKIVLCGENIYPIIKTFKLKNIKKNIVKKYYLKKMSFIKSIKYLYFMIESAIAVKQYKKMLSLKIAVLIAILSGENINVINILANDCLVSGCENGNSKLKLKDLFTAVLKNKEQVNKQIFYKIKKLVYIFVICLSLYFSIKIVTDRYNLIEKIKIKKEILQQEWLLRKQQDSEMKENGANDRV